MMTGEQLRKAYLSPQMLRYFERKLPELTPAELLVRVEEALKFLALAFHSEGNIPVVQEIDDIWHLWILETQEYWRLCERMHGCRYLHHSSNAFRASADAGPPSNTIEQDVAALADYVVNYGPFAPDRVRFWHLPRYQVDVCGMSVDELNAWLMTALRPAAAV
jgi:hypothetical protein